jgi:SAM-dependent methyltransferase
MNPPDPYCRQAPSPQTALDIFQGEWASRLPGRAGQTLRAGADALFEDPRVAWAAEQFAAFGIPVTGARVLELGPLEGGHSYLLRSAGAREVVAVEANQRAYLRCLVAKEILGYNGVSFLHGDATAYLMQTEEAFDLGFACGLLYHLVNPVELLQQLCRRCRAVFVWTMYYDSNYNRLHPGHEVAAGEPFRFEQGGFSHTLRRHDYGRPGDWSGFRGGSAPHAHWMEREEILGALRHFGFERQVTRDEQVTWGSALWVAAAPATR